MTAGIRVHDLAKSYDARPVFRGLSLDVVPGEFVALLGPSGAGKTTLLRCLTRSLDADRGQIWLAGHAMHELRNAALAAARRDVGFVFQQFNLVQRRSALENALAGRLASVPLWRILSGHYPRGDLRAAEQALARVGLRDRAQMRADRLSGGQQQRVAIARALVQGSKVLLADEPVASLDPRAARDVLGILRSIAHDDGLAVLCSLHQHDLAAEYADRVVAIDDLLRPVGRQS